MHSSNRYGYISILFHAVFFQVALIVVAGLLSVLGLPFPVSAIALALWATVKTVKARNKYIGSPSMALTAILCAYPYPIVVLDALIMGFMLSHGQGVISFLSYALELRYVVAVLCAATLSSLIGILVSLILKYGKSRLGVLFTTILALVEVGTVILLWIGDKQ